MSFVICEKHNKTERVGARAAANSFICMNRFCPNAFSVFCLSCKAEHRDHSIKVLTIEDLTFLLERLLKTPFLQVGGYVGEAVDVMKKLKLIKEFRKKIELLEREIQREALKLIESTESLIHEYAACKGTATELAEHLSFEQPPSFQALIANSQQLVGCLDYNAKKDRLEYGSVVTREGEERRRKCAEQAKQKIEQVKDYGMKIIEVILQHGDSSDQEDDIAATKKHYELLKAEIANQKTTQELQSQISQLKNSRSTANRSRVRRPCQNISTQTYDEVLSKEQAEEEIEYRLNQMRSSHMRVENDLRLKISIIAKEKDTSGKEINKYKTKLDDKKRQLGQLQQKLRANAQARIEGQQQREEAFKRIIELTQWKGLSLQDRFD